MSSEKCVGLGKVGREGVGRVWEGCRKGVGRV